MVTRYAAVLAAQVAISTLAPIAGLAVSGTLIAALFVQDTVQPAVSGMVQVHAIIGAVKYKRGFYGPFCIPFFNVNQLIKILFGRQLSCLS